MIVRDEKELGVALKEKVEEIEIEGDLQNKVLKIRATGKVAWAVAVGAIGVAFVTLITAAPSGGTTVFIAAAAAPVACSILGVSVATAAIAIAVAAGGVGALSRLRKYKIEKCDDGKLVLKK